VLDAAITVRTRAACTDLLREIPKLAAQVSRVRCASVDHACGWLVDPSCVLLVFMFAFLHVSSRACAHRSRT
jgi:hypothetical protein